MSLQNNKATLSFPLISSPWNLIRIVIENIRPRQNNKVTLSFSRIVSPWNLIWIVVEILRPLVNYIHTTTFAYIWPHKTKIEQY